MAIFLHIGFPKTATTSLQLAFREHVADLKAADVCYPLIDDDFKQRYLRLYDQKRQNLTEASTGDLKKSMQLMMELIQEANCSDVVLSCEELTNFMMMQYDQKNLEVMRDALRKIDDDVRIVAYVRNPSDFYLSILQEKIKRYAGVLEPETFHTNFAKTIRLYETVFETKAIVREFHPSKLIKRDIVADFLSATGLTRVDISKWEPIVSNESISPEVLCALDLARREMGGSKTSELSFAFQESEMFWRKMGRISREVGTPSKPVLFRHVHDTIMALNADDIKLLKERYGISFAEGKCIEGQSTVPKKHQISAIENLMKVDKQLAIYIWSVFSVRAIREIFTLRKKVRRLRASEEK
ncbi:hypothetical protein Q8W25_10105 [Shimia thalassica]|uniref:hypothetical protein n=1 Tax=Shimia thalassica TaxID=1715693 RepID=UPI0027343488|nr:hypothetical protein [Shimia thalassica]MDP2494366.1 hypothetical protein [Shimia thalassica]